MLDIICSIFDMALIIIFFNAIMKKKKGGCSFLAFSFYFRLHRRTSWLFSPVSFLCQAKPFFLYNGRNQFAFSIYSIFFV